MQGQALELTSTMSAAQRVQGRSKNLRAFCPLRYGVPLNWARLGRDSRRRRRFEDSEHGTLALTKHRTEARPSAQEASAAMCLEASLGSLVGQTYIGPSMALVNKEEEASSKRSSWNCPKPSGVLTLPTSKQSEMSFSPWAKRHSRNAPISEITHLLALAVPQSFLSVPHP